MIQPALNRHNIPAEALKRFGKKKQLGLPVDEPTAAEVRYCQMAALKEFEEITQVRSTNVRLDEGTGTGLTSRTTRTGAKDHDQRISAHHMATFVRCLNITIGKRKDQADWDKNFPILTLQSFVYIGGYGQNQEMDPRRMDVWPEPLNFDALKVCSCYSSGAGCSSRLRFLPFLQHFGGAYPLDNLLLPDFPPEPAILDAVPDMGGYANPPANWDCKATLFVNTAGELRHGL